MWPSPRHFFLSVNAEFCFFKEWRKDYVSPKIFREGVGVVVILITAVLSVVGMISYDKFEIVDVLLLLPGL